MWPGVVVWVERERSAKTKSLQWCRRPKKTGRRKQCRVLQAFLPSDTPRRAHLHVGGRSPGRRNSDQSRSFFSGPPKMQGERKVKGQAKHLEKPKSSLFSSSYQSQGFRSTSVHLTELHLIYVTA